MSASIERLGRIEAAIAALTTKIAAVTRPPRLIGGRRSTLYCSFCGKSPHEVDKLVAGPKTFICNECTDLCTESFIAMTSRDCDTQISGLKGALLMAICDAMRAQGFPISHQLVANTIARHAEAEGAA